MKVGEPISEELAIFRTKRFIEAASEEKMKEKIAPHMIPQNCEALQVKTRNREIWYMLRGQHKKKKINMRLTTLQKNISKVTIAIAKAADALTKSKDRKEVSNSERTKVIVRNITDSISFLGNAQQKTSAQRRANQNPALPYDVKDIVEMPADGLQWLYGNDVKKLIKEAKEQSHSAHAPLPLYLYKHIHRLQEKVTIF